MLIDSFMTWTDQNTQMNSNLSNKNIRNFERYVRKSEFEKKITENNCWDFKMTPFKQRQLDIFFEQLCQRSTFIILYLLFKKSYIIWHMTIIFFMLIKRTEFSRHIDPQPWR